MITTDQVRAKLRECYDPEIPCNIVDLGLVYEIRLALPRVEVTMTLTTPECPLARQITTQVQQRLLELPGVQEAEVGLVFDPPWDRSHISEEGLRQLRLR
jgi:metal-sulfur cluster biosynthetic enzyme